ncbi:MAG: hypothetical protein J6333_01265, partial [Planctomycetes bacterium]|nr:hypothetical protein [Planctomycetota bacterium]
MSATTLSRLDRQLQDLSPDSTRYQVLMAVRKFRSNWVELGRLLSDVAYGGDYKEWGYDDFEVYCAKELGLKKPTVHKLMVSYNYMKTYAPERLKAPDAERGYDVPDYQTVELLNQARQSDRLDDSAKDDLHRRAFAPWEDGASDAEPMDEVALRKEIRDRTRADPAAIAAANDRRGH